MAINRMGRDTLGAFRPTPLGIVAAESGHTPARARLNHRQARFAHRLHARPKDGEGPEEILDREAAALTTRLRAAASLHPGGTVEAQEWGNRRLFPGQVIVGSREGALQTAGSWTVTQRPGDTIWADGSRLDCGKVGAVCVWRTPGGWTGRRFYLGNEGVFDAAVYAISRAPSIIDQRQERGHRYTVFVDSTSAIDRVRSDSIGPGQCFAVTAIEACARIMSRSNEVSIRWVPAHQGVLGNEKADEYAKASAEGGRPGNDVPDEYRWETSLSHMTRVATEARSQAAAQWIADRLENPRRKY